MVEDIVLAMQTTDSHSTRMRLQLQKSPSRIRRVTLNYFDQADFVTKNRMIYYYARECMHATSKVRLFVPKMMTFKLTFKEAVALESIANPILVPQIL